MNETAKNLFENYKKLDKLEKYIIQYLSIHTIPLRENKLHKILNTKEFGKNIGREVKMEEVKSAIKNLHKMKLLVNSYFLGEFYCEEEIANPILYDIFMSNQSQELIQIFKSEQGGIINGDNYASVYRACLFDTKENYKEYKNGKRQKEYIF